MPTTTVHVDGIGSVPATITDRGQGHTYLLLHGGAGPLSVTAFADTLAETEQARVIAPTHPGFGGTPRPDALDSPRGLAALYIARTLTLVNADGLLVRAIFGQREVLWSDVRGLSVSGRNIYAVLGDGGALRLPCVRVRDLAAVSAARRAMSSSPSRL